MFEFYLIASLIMNAFLLIVWNAKNFLNVVIKLMFLVLSVTGIVLVINTFNLIH